MTPSEFASAVDDAFAVRFGALMNADPSIPVGRQSPPGVDGVERFAGPYDDVSATVTPFVVEAPNPDFVDMTAAQLFRDFTRWLHSGVYVELTDPPRTACAEGLKFVWIAWARTAKGAAL